MLTVAEQLKWSTLWWYLYMCWFIWECFDLSNTFKSQDQYIRFKDPEENISAFSFPDLYSSNTGQPHNKLHYSHSALQYYCSYYDDVTIAAGHAPKKKCFIIIFKWCIWARQVDISPVWHHLVAIKKDNLSELATVYFYICLNSSISKALQY